MFNLSAFMSHSPDLLGYGGHESIVPHATHLTTPAEEPHNVRDSFSRLNS